MRIFPTYGISLNIVWRLNPDKAPSFDAYCSSALHSCGASHGERRYKQLKYPAIRYTCVLIQFLSIFVFGRSRCRRFWLFSPDVVVWLVTVQRHL
jgi:hypothetical protein